MAPVGDWEVGIKKHAGYVTIQAFPRKETSLMAVIQQQKARTARMLLNNGTDVDGNTLTVNASISNISGDEADWDGDKLMNIVAALEPALSKAVEGVDTVVTYGITRQS